MSQDPNETPNLDYHEGSSVVEIHSAVGREKAEPQAGLEPVSIWAFIGAALVLAGGALYLGAFNGGFDMDNMYAATYTEEMWTKPAVEGAGSGGDDRPWIDQWMAKGGNVYATCGACHQANGAGQPTAGFPPLAGSEWVTGSTERLGALLVNGLEGPITVKGQQYGTQVMPAQGATLSAKQLAQVMTYIRRSWGNEATAVTEEMAQAALDKYRGRPNPWTAAELLEIPDDAMLEGAEVDLQTGLPPGEGAEGGDGAATDGGEGA